ncbi:MAG: universal stress protein [Desulfamplus sp.]|nr:universal stress protein [Desulfamplus sp.]
MMKKINTILVALDFSPYSKQVLESAVETAKKTGAQILVVNVINRRDIDTVKKIFEKEQPGTFSMQKYMSDDLGRRSRLIQELIVECGGDKNQITTLFMEGVPFEQILKAIIDEKADLVIMGKKGKTNLASVLFGGCAEKIFRHSPVPVFSVR